MGRRGDSTPTAGHWEHTPLAITISDRATTDARGFPRCSLSNAAVALQGENFELAAARHWRLAEKVTLPRHSPVGVIVPYALPLSRTLILTSNAPTAEFV